MKRPLLLLVTLALVAFYAWHAVLFGAQLASMNLKAMDETASPALMGSAGYLLWLGVVAFNAFGPSTTKVPPLAQAARTNLKVVLYALVIFGLPVFVGMPIGLLVLPFIPLWSGAMLAVAVVKHEGSQN